MSLARLDPGLVPPLVEEQLAPHERAKLGFELRLRVPDSWGAWVEAVAAQHRVPPAAVWRSLLELGIDAAVRARGSGQ